MSHQTPLSTQQDAPDADLAAAIENLYNVFKRYPLKSPTEGCPCCVTADEVAQLESKPLRQLLPTDLDHFAKSALTTWGSVADFKHFLPRILECIAFNADVPFDIEIAIGKLAYGQWQDWPQAERLAVRQYLKSWWRYQLSNPVVDGLYRSQIDTILCAIGRAEVDVADYLNIWRNAPLAAGSLQLADLIHHNQACLLKRRELNNAFWEDPQMEQVIIWLCEPETGQQLETAFYQAVDEAAKASLSLAVQEWEWLKVRCG